MAPVFLPTCNTTHHCSSSCIFLTLNLRNVNLLLRLSNLVAAQEKADSEGGIRIVHMFHHTHPITPSQKLLSRRQTATAIGGNVPRSVPDNGRGKVCSQSGARLFCIVVALKQPWATGQMYLLVQAPLEQPGATTGSVLMAYLTAASV